MRGWETGRMGERGKGRRGDSGFPTPNTQHLTPLLLVCLLILSIAGSAFGAYETGGVAKAILSNGVTVLVHPEPEVNVAAIEVFLRLGAADETDFNAGIGNLLAGSILAGTKTRSAVKLARLVSEAGGNFHALWQWNYLEINAVTSPSNCGDTIALLSDSLLNAKFDSDAVEYSRASMDRDFQHQGEDAFNSAYTAVRKLIHAGSPYDRSYLGNADKVNAIRREELAKFHDYHVSSDRIVVSVVGNVDTQSVIKKVQICFGDVKRISKPEGPESYSSTGSGEVTMKNDTSSTYLMVGYPAAGLNDPDYPAMSVANVLFGGNKSSLLFTKLREEKGLGYQVGSLYPPLQGSSHLVAYLGMDASRATPEILQGIRKEITDQAEALRSGGFSDDDLERAKRYLIGTQTRKRERTKDRAFYLGWNEAVGLGYQYEFKSPELVKSVTRADILRVCNRFLKNPSVVIDTGTPSK